MMIDELTYQLIVIMLASKILLKYPEEWKGSSIGGTDWGDKSTYFQKQQMDVNKENTDGLTP